MTTAKIDKAEPEAVRLERGPRPKNTRLREGAKQIEDYGEAVEIARKSLTRVEKELSEAQDEDSIERLKRKRELIEKSIERLSKVTDSQ